MRFLEIAILSSAAVVNVGWLTTFSNVQPAMLQATQGGVPNSQPPQHPQKQPDQPSTTPGGNTNPIGLEGNAANGTSRPTTRTTRPFMLTDPASEARFMDSSRRLVAVEQRMIKSSTDLLKQIGDARQMTGERQNKAILDILQQVAQNQAEMQEYLVQARAGWTGDIDAGAAGGAGDRAPIDTSVPAQTTPPAMTTPPTVPERTNPPR